MRSAGLLVARTFRSCAWHEIILIVVLPVHSGVSASHVPMLGIARVPSADALLLSHSERTSTRKSVPPQTVPDPLHLALYPLYRACCCVVTVASRSLEQMPRLSTGSSCRQAQADPWRCIPTPYEVQQLPTCCRLSQASACSVYINHRINLRTSASPRLSTATGAPNPPNTHNIPHHPASSLKHKPPNFQQLREPHLQDAANLPSSSVARPLLACPPPHTSTRPCGHQGPPLSPPHRAYAAIEAHIHAHPSTASDQFVLLKRTAPNGTQDVLQQQQQQQQPQQPQ